VVPTIDSNFVGARECTKEFKTKTFLFFSCSISAYYDSHSNTVKIVIREVMPAYL